MMHAILGAGGIGGFLGGALARSGQPVTLLVRPAALATHPRTVAVTSQVLGDFEAPVTVSAGLARPVDVIWVAVKSTQLDEALALLPADEVGDALVVPLLNGVEHMARLRARYEPDRVIAGTIRAESERLAPGRIRQPSPFAVIRLAAVGPCAPRVRELAEEVQKTGITCEVVEDEPSLLWGKLAFLAPLALTTTALGAPLGDVRGDPTWRGWLEACVGEACAAAEADGARVDHASILTLLDSAPDGMRSSMQKDVEAGRRPELDAIAGPIVRLGRAHGFETPIIEMLIDRIAQKTT